MPANYVTARIKLQKEFAPELDKINARIPTITEDIQELTRQVINTRVHVGPIIFIAQSLGKDVNDATKYMILLIIFAFDPLAVMLTIGVNIALVDRKRVKDEKTKIKTSHEHRDDFVPVQENNITDNNSETNEKIQRLEKMIEEFNQKEELTSEEQIKRQELEELIKRKKITQDIRSV
jgi:Mg2+/citrate symporter